MGHSKIYILAPVDRKDVKWPIGGAGRLSNNQPSTITRQRERERQMSINDDGGDGDDERQCDLRLRATPHQISDWTLDRDLADRPWQSP